jgi:ATP-binding protein involved in chromosome partitioning
MTFLIQRVFSNINDKMQRTLPIKEPLKGIKRFLVVGSGKGGVGKSTIAVNLCNALAKKGKKIGILDADIYGPSIPTMYGLDIRQKPSLSGDLMIPFSKSGVKVMSIGFLSGGSAIVWRGLLVMKALQQLLRQVEWGELDYLIADLPPGTGDIHLNLIQTVPIDGAILVTTPQKVSVIDVEKAADMFRLTNIPIIGYVENMSYFTCPNCSSHHEIFKKNIESSFLYQNYKCLVQIPIVPKLSHYSDLGESTNLALFDSLADSVINEIKT